MEPPVGRIQTAQEKHLVKKARFLTPEIEDRYRISCVNEDLEESLRHQGFEVNSWGTVEAPAATEMQVLHFQDNLNAASCLAALLQEHPTAPRVKIFWANLNTQPIEANKEILTDYAADVLAEDWDCWILWDPLSVIEKYHEGHVRFMKNQVPST